MSKFFAGIAVTLVFLGLAGGAFYFGTKYSASPISPVTTTPSPTTPVPAPTNPAPQNKNDAVNPSGTIAAITVDIPKKDYTDLAKYMDGAVTIGAWSSGCCQTNSKAEVIAELSTNLKDIKGPWDFSDANPIAIKVSSAEPQNFKDRIIGTSIERRTLAFTLNNKFLISRVFILNDYEFLVK